jgi:antitoxin (DNA-binding transcriptional repressor) of toxin-antitoxin stability system
MRKASITVAKNNLSKLLQQVKSGAAILILERNRPVARLELVASEEEANDGRVASLVAQGLAKAPRRRLDTASFLSREWIRLPNGASAVEAPCAQKGSRKGEILGFLGSVVPDCPGKGNGGVLPVTPGGTPDRHLMREPG